MVLNVLEEGETWVSSNHKGRNYGEGKNYGALTLDIQFRKNMDEFDQAGTSISRGTESCRKRWRREICGWVLGYMNTRRLPFVH